MQGRVDRESAVHSFQLTKPVKKPPVTNIHGYCRRPTTRRNSGHSAHSHRSPPPIMDIISHTRATRLRVRRRHACIQWPSGVVLSMHRRRVSRRRRARHISQAMAADKLLAKVVVHKVFGDPGHEGGQGCIQPLRQARGGAQHGAAHRANTSPKEACRLGDGPLGEPIDTHQGEDGGGARHQGCHPYERCRWAHSRRGPEREEEQVGQQILWTREGAVVSTCMRGRASPILGSVPGAVGGYVPIAARPSRPKSLSDHPIRPNRSPSDAVAVNGGATTCAPV